MLLTGKKEVFQILNIFLLKNQYIILLKATIFKMYIVDLHERNSAISVQLLVGKNKL